MRRTPSDWNGAELSGRHFVASIVSSRLDRLKWLGGCRMNRTEWPGRRRAVTRELCGGKSVN